MQWQAFNVLNTTNLYMPNGDMALALKPDKTFSTSSSFGKSTQAFDPRIMQVSARFFIRVIRLAAAWEGILPGRSQNSTVARKGCGTGLLGGPRLENATSPYISNRILSTVCLVAGAHQAVQLIRRRCATAASLQFLFQAGPAGSLGQSAGRARSLPWSGVVAAHSDSYLFSGTLFLRMDLSLGSLNHFLGNIRSNSMRRKTLIASNRYKKWQATKYFLLIGGLLAALCRSSIVGWIDPFSLLVRSLGVSVLPAAASKKYYIVYQPHYWPSVLMGVVFLVLLVMNLRVTRFCCRALCPLGALLGLAARWSLLGLHKDAATCNQCSRCLVSCQGGDDPIGGVPWRKAECHLCLNCVEACPHGSLEFRFFRKLQTPPEVVGTNLSRRTALAAMVSGLAVVPLLRAQTLLSNSRNERLIRPPGALSETDFLSRCIRCGECMRVCPNNALQPTFTEAGLTGLWSPVVTPKIGYCEPSCVLCSEVCPTGAIQEADAPAKRLGRWRMA